MQRYLHTHACMHVCTLLFFIHMTTPALNVAFGKCLIDDRCHKGILCNCAAII